MTNAAELLRQGRRKEVWQKYCGFFDLTVKEFMIIQERLLVEQLRLLSDCELGKAMAGGDVPRDLDTFRSQVPITTYRDYIPFLSAKNGDVLPVKPRSWMRTSGRSGEYRGKWAPCPQAFYEQIGKYGFATILLASARDKGEIRTEEGDTFLYAVAPPPYISGTSIRAIHEEFPLRIIPPIEEAESMDFRERMEEGFLRSIDTGIGYFMGIASVLLGMGEAFAKGSGQFSMSTRLLRPMAIYRIGRALLTSRLQRRPMTPKDLWNAKGLVASGMDVQVYRPRIEALWGCKPLEAYACTEFGTVALQAWGAKSEGLTLVPDAAFWEFMPEEEFYAWRRDSTYQPKTELLNEVQPGRYVLIGTSFAGGAFVRYFVGDMVSVISLGEPKLGITLPQIMVESRADDVIDLGTLVLLTERTVWRAIGHLDLPLVNWTARKEYGTGKDQYPFIHIYIEGEDVDPDQLSPALHAALIECDEDYATFNNIMARNPIEVTRLATGTFQRYLEEMEAEEADLGQLKPPRMQPSEENLARLLRINAALEGAD
jgi:hypothetical protein